MDEVSKYVDGIVDEWDIDAIDEDCDRLGISVGELMDRVKTELMARLTGRAS